MGFFGQGVWIIGYRGLMGYGMGIPAYQSRIITPLWGFGGYGLFTLWVMRGSTVSSNSSSIIHLPRGLVSACTTRELSTLVSCACINMSLCLVSQVTLQSSTFASSIDHLAKSHVFPPHHKLPKSGVQL